MLKKYADKWIKALRSGKYKQGKEKLCQVDGKTAKYCCLGVLCDILGTPYIKKGEVKDYGNYEMEVLPESVQHKVKIKHNEGKFINSLGNEVILSVLNDDEDKSFKEIANVIEENWKIL